MAAAAFVITCVVIVGSVLRIGPFAAAPAKAITDPEEILAGSLQALLDATTFRLQVEVEAGVVPARVAGTARPLDVAGAEVVADVDLGAVRSSSVITVPSLGGSPVQVVTIWDAASIRAGTEPWVTASVADTISASGIDLNPVTLVERVRAWLEEDPDARVTRGRDLPCVAGLCRVVTLEGGAEPLVLASALLPPERSAALPDADVTITVQADVATLRPVVAFLEVVAADGTLLVKATVRFRDWNEPVVIDEPGASPAEGLLPTTARRPPGT
jgi:hypothetical protein